MHGVPVQQKQLLLGHDSCQQSKPQNKFPHGEKIDPLMEPDGSLNLLCPYLHLLLIGCHLVTV